MMWIWQAVWRWWNNRCQFCNLVLHKERYLYNPNDDVDVVCTCGDWACLKFRRKSHICKFTDHPTPAVQAKRLDLIARGKIRVF
jgi:hypothetical protein